MKKISITVSFGVDGCLSTAITEAAILAFQEKVKVNFRYGNSEYSVDYSKIVDFIESNGRTKS